MIDRDKYDLFRFAALQSEKGELLQSEYGISSNEIDSVVVIFEEKVYNKSLAAFKIASFLGFPYFLLKYFRILPVSFSNFLYDLIAKNRYKLYGKKETCRIPTPAERAKFL